MTVTGLMPWALAITTLSLALALADAQKTKPKTINLPDNGGSHFRGSQVVCTPANWYDILSFFFTNFLMHALSVRSLPGENTFTSIVFKFTCLLIPFTGIRRGLCLIARASNFARNDLQAAAQANALCMVVRGESWRPTNESEIQGCRVEKIKGSTASGQENPVSESRVEEVAEKTIEEDTKVTDASKEKNGGEDQCPTVQVREESTASSAVSTTDATGMVVFTMTDCYEPPSANSFLEKVYRIFVETYKFSREPLSKSIRLDPEYVKVHGLCELAPGYELAYVPPDIKVYPSITPRVRPSILASLWKLEVADIMNALKSQTRLASTQNAPRILFSLSQTISGAWSIYRAQGAQIDRFGFAAYGLTVLPYMIVSIINFAGSLLTKEYDMIYMVRSSMMDEMLSRGGSVDGVVGSLEPREEDLAEPTSGSSTFGAPELLIPEGRTLQFRMGPDANFTTLHPTSATEDNRNADHTLTYRDSPASTWSSPLTVTTLPKWKPPPLDPVTVDRASWRRIKSWYRRKYKNTQGEQPPAGLTVIHTPCHGPLLRLPAPVYESSFHVLTIALLVAAVAVPFIVITVLTGWKRQESESSHRNFVINWLISGMLLGYAAGSVEKLSGNKTTLKGLGIGFVCYGSYCIGGFVTVAQQMRLAGKCTAL